MAADLPNNQELLELPQHQVSEDGVASADLQRVSDSAERMNDMDRVQETLRALAETQRALVTGREGSGCRKIGTRLEEHPGMWVRRSRASCGRGGCASSNAFTISLTSSSLYLLLWTFLSSAILWELAAWRWSGRSLIESMQD